jgi:hypothetical protein
MFDLVCYIDESGEEGLDRKPGTSQWFILTGVVLLKK